MYIFNVYIVNTFISVSGSNVLLDENLLWVSEEYFLKKFYKKKDKHREESELRKS